MNHRQNWGTLVSSILCSSRRWIRTAGTQEQLSGYLIYLARLPGWRARHCMTELRDQWVIWQRHPGQHPAMVIRNSLECRHRRVVSTGLAASSLATVRLWRMVDSIAGSSHKTASCFCLPSSGEKWEHVQLVLRPPLGWARLAARYIHLNTWDGEKWVQAAICTFLYEYLISLLIGRHLNVLIEWHGIL